MNLRRLRTRLLATGAAAISCYPAVAYAQAALPVQTAATAPPATASASQATSNGLEEIIVTAQKRSENLQRVPVAVSAISARTIETANISTVDQLVSLVPGLQVTHTSSGAQPFVRGVGTNSSGIGNEPAVATYVDGVYRPSPAGSVFSFNDIERIEVLKGPQGTLFGRNAAGGVVNIVTKDPTAEAALQAEVGYGNYDTFTGNFYASGGFSDDAAADVSVLYSHQGDGWGTNLVDGKDTVHNSDIAVRSKLLLRPWTRTRITLIGDYDRSLTGIGADFAVTPGQINNAGYGHAGGFYDIDSNVEPYNIQKQGGVALKVEQDLTWAQFTSISSWRAVRAPSVLELDGSPAPVVQYDFVEKEKTITQEFNLQSEAISKVKWIAGFFYFDDLSRYDPIMQQGTAYGLGPDGGFVVHSRQKTKSYAGYAQATVPLLNDSTHFTGGLRYTSDEKSEAAERTLISSGAPAPYRFATDFPFSVHQPKLTYKASLDHSFTQDILAYASYSRGYKSGNYNLTSPTQTPTKPEVLDAYEIGLKTELFDRLLRANVAGFYYKFHDKQVSSFVGTSTLLTNAAEANYKGIEAEITIAPAKGLSLNGGFTYVDSHYASYPGAVFITLLPAGGVSAASSGDATGNRVLFVDKLTASGTLQYRTEQTFGVVTAQSTVNYHDGFFFDAQNITRQPSYTTLDANLAWALRSGHVTVTLWGKNLTDAHYFAGRAKQAGTGDLYGPAPPRTFGVRIGYRM